MAGALPGGKLLEQSKLAFRCRQDGQAPLLPPSHQEVVARRHHAHFEAVGVDDLERRNIGKRCVR